MELKDRKLLNNLVKGHLLGINFKRDSLISRCYLYNVVIYRTRWVKNNAFCLPSSSVTRVNTIVKLLSFIKSRNNSQIYTRNHAP